MLFMLLPNFFKGNNMLYVSIDIETTGLNHETCDIVEFAAVIDDLNNQQPLHKLPTFQRYIYKELYQGEPYALAMHHELFAKLAKWQKNKNGDLDVCTPDRLIQEFYTFLSDYYVTDKLFCYGRNIKIQVAGKNFAAFDARFIEKLCNKAPYKIEFNYRVMDPAILYFNPSTDKGPPSMWDCMKRAGIEGTVAHTALEDALMVVNLLRKKFPPVEPQPE
jgi:oligoribonuclease